MNTNINYPLSFIRKSFFLLMQCFLAALLISCSAKRPAPADSYIPEDYIKESDLIDFDTFSLNTIPNNPHPTLSVPTYITKINDIYFIVDCYNDQVIYHDNLEDPLYEWQVMTNDISKGHTLASDGTVYLIDDTENNRILVMEQRLNENGRLVFVPTQEFSSIGDRPHYIIYDEYTDTFYAWSSQSGEMYLFRHAPDNPRMYLTEVRSIPSLNGVYVRSFTIIDDRIYFVSGNSSIIEADLYSFKIKKEYPVPSQMAGMIQLTKIEDYFYITISTDVTGNQDYATIIRVHDLNDLPVGGYEDVYSHFIGGGTPYYITQIDQVWYLTEHRLPGHSIWRFQVVDNKITNVISIY
ncbi:MAG: hypothetical protein OSJ60_14925 [Lachnospiraceae bacterium]|jgi:hypothetical protein|nr:hypothetical protein C819_01346 [Lachnospiraceae bacterium 10-1]MCX4352913.1 hypothetical protein [Lachnospiraceae bacterium]